VGIEKNYEWYKAAKSCVNSRLLLTGIDFLCYSKRWILMKNSIKKAVFTEKEFPIVTDGKF